MPIYISRHHHLDHFIQELVTINILLSKNTHLPQFHTRVMKQALFTKYGRVASEVKPVVFPSLYKDLICDSSAPHDTHEAEVDAHVREILNMEPEDPTTVLDLHEVKFEVFC